MACHLFSSLPGLLNLRHRGEVLKIGKVPNKVLEKRVFAHLNHVRDDVIKEPWIGEDTAMMDFGEELCVMSVDPITGASKNIGSLAVHISCNDVATAGAEAAGVLLTLLLPPETTEEELEEIMIDASKEAKKLNVSILGGHTEVTDAVNRITVVSTVIGRMKREDMLQVETIQPGDCVAITKAIALEGTLILAKEHNDELRDYFSDEEWDEIMALSEEISVVKDGRIAAQHGAKYMHDITEGGVLGALWEAGEATGFGIAVDLDAIPMLDVSKKLFAYYEDVDILKTISSGSMLIVLGREDREEMEKAFEEEGMKFTVIGEMTDAGVVEIKQSGEKLDEPDSDHLYQALKQKNF